MASIAGRKSRLVAFILLLAVLASQLWIFFRTEEITAWSRILTQSVSALLVGAATAFLVLRGSSDRTVLPLFVLSCGVLWAVLWGTVGFAVSRAIEAVRDYGLWVLGVACGLMAGEIFGCISFSRIRSSLPSLAVSAVWGGMAGVSLFVPLWLVTAVKSGTLLFPGWLVELWGFAFLGVITGGTSRFLLGFLWKSPDPEA